MESEFPIFLTTENIVLKRKIFKHGWYHYEVSCLKLKISIRDRYISHVDDDILVFLVFCEWGKKIVVALNRKHKVQEKKEEHKRDVMKNEEVGISLKQHLEAWAQTNAKIQRGCVIY